MIKSVRPGNRWLRILLGMAALLLLARSLA